MRVFVGIDLDDGIRSGIVRFMEDIRPLAPEARWISPESLHVTLKFIGEKPEHTVQEIEAALRQVECDAVQVALRGCGFFPTAKAARVFWIGIQSANLVALARAVENQLAAVAIPREERAYSPHLTLARASGGSGAPGWRKGDKPNRQFGRLQEVLAESPSPDFGTMSAREFFLYKSELGRGGARYTKIAQFLSRTRDR